MNMKKLRALKAVYSYFFPEVRPLIHLGDKISDELFLTSTSQKKASTLLKRLSFKKPLEVPATPEGNIDLDMIHVPIIARIVDAYTPYIPALKDFSHTYPTAGSSPGIFHLLALLKTKGIDSIYVLEGEYEGYKEYGKTLGVKVVEINPDITDIGELKSGFWFISNPSARDGNIIPNEFITSLCNAGHTIILDFAYVGSTRPYTFDVSHENIFAIVMSFSKPYGVFRFRIGGFAFSRKPIPSLYGNKWFKDIGRLLIALKIVEELSPGVLYTKYRLIQEKIIQEINKDFGLGLRASDALLLGYLIQDDIIKYPKSLLDMIRPFKRGGGYRFCLTPYFEEYEF
ncbi:aminotransferase class I/II-fold pyridoxal phosphate-dependent enzyme [Patescibacteria group bacterium AH-259-L07]|nr:aminotransferase class I/II-fold pyridoxal phosphate-dependent enzyme [Patescibacteria group bacterium AH-259-L07]